MHDTTVLVVDDSPQYRLHLRSLIEESKGVAVTEAGTGSEALEAMSKEPPATAIIDMRLPDMSGMELARRIRTQWPEVRVLLLSGYDFAQYDKAAKRLGIEGFVSKDAAGSELLARVIEG